MKSHQPPVRERMWDRIEAALQAKWPGAQLTALYPAMGYWRHVKADVMAWQGSAGLPLGDGSYRQISVAIGSWHSLTDLERRGFEIVDNRESSAPREVELELFAKDKRVAR